jgi:hypothetical protein
VSAWPVAGALPRSAAGRTAGNGASDADVAWIQESTAPGLSITSAIPPVFAAYATIVVPDTNEGRFEHGRLVLRLLSEQSGDQPWWRGYLDTGSDDLVFPDAPAPLQSGVRRPRVPSRNAGLVPRAVTPDVDEGRLNPPSRSSHRVTGARNGVAPPEYQEPGGW